MEETGPFTLNTRREFELLFRNYYSELCSYANTWLKDTDAAEDVVQEVMFRIWVNRASLVITTSVKSYLYRAVRNSSMNVLKHVNIREQYKEQRTVDQTEEIDTLEISELQQKIRHAIDLLPIERKKVFIMSRYEGLTYNQIADILGISVKTVENQMGKALKFLREELSDYLPFIVFLFFDLFKNN